MNLPRSEHCLISRNLCAQTSTTVATVVNLSFYRLFKPRTLKNITSQRDVIIVNDGLRFFTILSTSRCRTFTQACKDNGPGPMYFIIMSKRKEKNLLFFISNKNTIPVCFDKHLFCIFIRLNVEEPISYVVIK